MFGARDLPLFIATALVLFLLAVVALAHRARSLGARPSVRRALSLLGASLFAALAGRLALSSR